MAHGFQTAQGSLYVLDSGGRTSRYKQSPGAGQGQWQQWMHCVFIESSHKDPSFLMSARDLYDPIGQRLDLTFVDSSGIPSPMPYGDRNQALARPADCKKVGIIIQDRATGQYVVHHEAHMSPRVGLIPVEKGYDETGGGINHMGHAVTRVFDSAIELRDAFRAAGVKKIRLPVEYIDELKKADSAAASDERGEYERTRSTSPKTLREFMEERERQGITNEPPSKSRARTHERGGYSRSR